MNLTGVISLLGTSLVLAGAYGWWNTTNMHLPMSHIVPFASTLLPILSVAAVQYLRAVSWRQTANSNSRKKGHSPQLIEAATIATCALFLVDTVIITLSDNSIAPDQMDYPLSERWTQLWTSPTERGSLHPAIEGIQDALHCCGFKSDSDKSYPFSDRVARPRDPDDEYLAQILPCTAIHPKRSGKPCYNRWLEQQQLSASLILTAAIGSALMKAAALLFIKYPQHPLVQLFLYGRIPGVEDDEEYRDEESGVSSNGVSSNGVRSSSNTARVSYLPATENDRLLGAGSGNSEDGQSEEFRGLNFDQKKFWALASLLASR